MSSVFPTAKTELLAKVFGLTVACPSDQGNPCDCPLHEVRKLSLRERHEWARGLSEADMRVLIGYHEKCSTKKLIHPL